MDDFELEADFEAFVEYVRELQDERERRGNVRIINPVRLAEMRDAVDALKKVICEDDSDAKISFSSPLTNAQEDLGLFLQGSYCLLLLLEVNFFNFCDARYISPIQEMALL